MSVCACASVSASLCEMLLRTVCWSSSNANALPLQVNHVGVLSAHGQTRFVDRRTRKSLSEAPMMSASDDAVFRSETGLLQES